MHLHDLTDAPSFCHQVEEPACGPFNAQLPVGEKQLHTRSTYLPKAFELTGDHAVGLVQHGVETDVHDCTICGDLLATSQEALESTLVRLGIGEGEDCCRAAEGGRARRSVNVLHQVAMRVDATGDHKTA